MTTRQGQCNILVVRPLRKSRDQNVTKTTFEIDGSNLANREGFYDEVSRVLIPGDDWGRNLDAFNDILRGASVRPKTVSVSSGGTTRCLDGCWAMSKPLGSSPFEFSGATPTTAPE